MHRNNSFTTHSSEDSMYIACENIRFSSLFAAGESRETFPAAKSEAHFTVKEFEFITYPFYPQYLVRAFRNGFIRKPPIHTETKPTLE